MYRQARFLIPLLLLVLLISLLLVVYGAADHDRNPIDTVKAAFNAYQKNNRDTLAQQFCVPELADLSFPAQDDGRYTFSALSYTAVDSASPNRKVRVTGSAQSNNQPPTPFDWTITLQPNNSAWCIASIVQTPNS